MQLQKIERLKRETDILALIGKDTKLERVATTRGGEWAGACPFCGGRDRLRVQPDRGLWWCRSCSPTVRWQDVIAYIMRREESDFKEAVSMLNNGNSSSHSVIAPSPLSSHKDLQPDSQPTDWEHAAREVIDVCQQSLRHDESG